MIKRRSFGDQDMSEFFKLSEDLKARHVRSIAYHKNEKMISINYRRKFDWVPVENDIGRTLAKIDFILVHRMDSKTIEGCKNCITENWPYIEDGNEEHRQHTSEYNFMNGNGNGNCESANDPLLIEKLTEQDIDFVIDTMIKEAKHDKISIKQIFYGINSGFTKVVIHSNINSKNAGAGKSYLLILVSDFFPSRHILTLVGASDKAFQHKEGTMVLEDLDTGELTEVEPILNELRSEILDLDNELEKEKQKETQARDKTLINQLKKQISEKENEIKYVIEHQQKLIDLNNTIILLLDTPQDAITDGLMSLLSNDTSRDQKYLYTDKSASGKLGSKYNILRGTPVMFTTRVIDDTRSPRFEEKNRRFINITPNVTNEKIQDANFLIAKKYGLTTEEYDTSVVSKNDKEKAKRIVSILVEKLINHSKYFNPKESGIKIPFIGSISIPDNDVWSMTVMDRMMRYLTIITKVNMDNRPRLVRKNNRNIFLPIATFKDLKETLELMERGGSNIRPYIADWYNQVFLPLYLAENDAVKISINDDNLCENYVAVTSTQLRDKTKEVYGISISSDDLRHKYIDPLVNQGLIDKARSEIRKSENIYFPVDETGRNIFSLFTNNDQRLHVNIPGAFPCKRSIINSFQATSEYGEKHRDMDGGIFEKNILDIYSLEDPDGIEITLDHLVEKYYSDPETCFIKDYKEKDELEE